MTELFHEACNISALGYLYGAYEGDWHSLLELVDGSVEVQHPHNLIGKHTRRGGVTPPTPDLSPQWRRWRQRRERGGGVNAAAPDRRDTVWGNKPERWWGPGTWSRWPRRPRPSSSSPAAAAPPGWEAPESPWRRTSSGLCPWATPPAGWRCTCNSRTQQHRRCKRQRGKPSFHTFPLAPVLGKFTF